MKKGKAKIIQQVKSATISLKQYAHKFAAQELPDSNELRKILEDMPLSYIALKSDAIDEMSLFTKAAIILREQEIAASESTDDLTKVRPITKSKKEPIVWAELKKLREDIAMNPKNHNMGEKDLSLALIRLKFLEYNWPRDRITSVQLTQLRKAQVLLKTINNLSNKEIKSLGFKSNISPSIKDIPALIKIAESKDKINLKITKDTYLDIVKGNGTVAIEWEDPAINKYKAGLSNIVTSEINKIYKNNSKSKKSFFNTLNIINIESSPSFLDNLDDLITTAILGKKLPKYKKKTVSKTQYKLLSTQKVKNAKRKLGGKSIPKIPTFKKLKEGAELPLYSIRRLINQSLASQIKDNMGAPNDPAVLLRNQTGRFAESAKLLTLTRSGVGNILGTYTYQRKPYDVFLPGHKLGTPKRDPKIYIEGSIRELAMAILKRKFPGLTLELL